MNKGVKVNSPSPPPPPPPPLPPLPVTFQMTKLNSQALNTSELSKIDENELNLAIKRLISANSKYNEIFYLSNTSLVPQLQDGPKCGLVALSIASSASDNFVNVEYIFQIAVSLGLTKQGEMFSSESLALLAEKCCGFRTKIITGGLIYHFHCIVTSLLNKCLVLVPFNTNSLNACRYDADFNHSPCCKNGSKAHWAVVTGFLIFEQKNSRNNGLDSDFLMLNSWKSSDFCKCIDKTGGTEHPLTFSINQEKILIGKKSPEEIQRSFNEGNIYLIGLQGKSRYLGLWSFHEMAESNNNLILFSASRNSDYYVLPKGGLEEGLKGKAIILTRI